MAAGVADADFWSIEGSPERGAWSKRLPKSFVELGTLGTFSSNPAAPGMLLRQEELEKRANNVADDERWQNKPLKTSATLATSSGPGPAGSGFRPRLESASRTDFEVAACLWYQGSSNRVRHSTDLGTMALVLNGPGVGTGVG
uniref:Uncharacterized protein n=1 Tax=Anopheles farauti TaxID=69004 RepID=A0A182QZ09_9DIPT